MKVLAISKIGSRAFLALGCCILLQACVSSSLEDAAPRSLTANNLPTTLDKSIGDTTARGVIADTVPQTSRALQTQTLNADIPAKYDKQGFPTFAETPQGEVSQLSEPEKIAIETKMTELLLSHASDENVRAGFEAKLKRLRELAKTHEQNADAIISQ